MLPMDYPASIMNDENLTAKRKKPSILNETHFIRTDGFLLKLFRYQ